MNETMISVLDILENDPTGRGWQGIRDELFEMDMTVKRHMDTGLGPDEWAVAEAVREAVRAAGRTVDNMAG